MLTQFNDINDKGKFDPLYDRIMKALETTHNFNKTIYDLQAQMADNRHKIRELGGGFSVYPNNVEAKNEMMKLQNLNVDMSQDVEAFTKGREFNMQYTNQLINLMDLVDKDGAKRIARINTKTENITRFTCF